MIKTVTLRYMNQKSLPNEYYYPQILTCQSEDHKLKREGQVIDFIEIYIVCILAVTKVIVFCKRY